MIQHMDTRKVTAKAVEMLGGPVKASRSIGILRYQTVQQWVARGQIPPEYCPTIERLLDGAVRCEDLRPEIDWAYLRSTNVSAEAS